MSQRNERIEGPLSKMFDDIIEKALTDGYLPDEIVLGLNAAIQSSEELKSIGIVFTRAMVQTRIDRMRADSARSIPSLKTGRRGKGYTARVPEILLILPIAPETPAEEAAPKSTPPLPKKDQERIDQIIALIGRGDGQLAVLTAKTVAGVFVDMSTTVAKRLLYIMVERNILTQLESPSGEDVFFARNLPAQDNGTDPFLYKASEFVSALHTKHVDLPGAYLETCLEGGIAIRATIEGLRHHAAILDIPVELLWQVLHAFAEAGMLTIRANGAVTLPKSHQSPALTHTALRAHAATIGLLGASHREQEAGSGIVQSHRARLRKAYAEHERIAQVIHIPISLAGERIRIMTLTELLIGHQAFDYKSLDEFIEMLRNRPDLRPDVILVSSVILGQAQLIFKNSRSGKPDGMRKESQQIPVAHEYLEDLRKIGCLVIYCMGAADRRIIETRTVQATNFIAGVISRASKAKGNAVSWLRLDSAMRDEALWDPHLMFQFHVVYPYILRRGLTLKSGWEYLQLHGYWNAKRSGQDVNGWSGIDEAALISIYPEDFERQRATGLIICDDCDITATTASGRVLRVAIRHHKALTAVNQPGDPTAAVRDILGQEAARGNPTYDLYVLLNYHRVLAVQEGSTYVTTTPGMITGSLKWRASRTGVANDIDHRSQTTFKQLPQAGSVVLDLHADGTRRTTLLTRDLMDRMDARSERYALVMLSDWQTFSITMRPEIVVSLMTHVLHTVARDMKLVLLFGGDHSHGRNYPETCNENAATRLARVDDQMEFNAQMVGRILSCVPAHLLERIEAILAVPGNHEWNTVPGRTGAYFVKFLRSVFELAFARKQVNGAVPIIADNVRIEERGDVFRGFVGKCDVANYGVVVQHMITERGGKGSGGLPILNAKTLMSGLGGVLRDTNLLFSGHLHHAALYVAAGKAVTITPVAAGLSWFEWQRAHMSQLGATIGYVGGGKPVEIEFLSFERLMRLPVPEEAYFSRQHLKDIGFVDDKKFDPMHHGFIRAPGIPQGAIHKALHHITDEVVTGIGTKF